MSALKYDSGKTRYELIPADALEAFARHWTVGAQKYEDHNWARGMAWTRVFGALMRHAWAWMRGESYDPETGSHHMMAVAWAAFALFCYETRGVGADDRPVIDRPLGPSDTQA